MSQMNLFNTSSSVSGFRLDYMEIYNWGTFDGEVFCIRPQGNNSLLTGANASGKSTLIDALLTLLVPLKRQRFYNQSSGVERKGNRTEESYFLGYYGNQHLEGSSGSTTLKLRDKTSTYSVLLASFSNVDNRVATLFQIRYFSGEEVKVLFGIAKEKLSIVKDLSDFKNDGAWRRSFEKRHNANSSKKIVEFFDGPTYYQTKMLSLFGMRSDKALALFNQFVGVKVLDDLDSFIRDKMLEEPQPTAEEKYQELQETFQNLMEAKTNIEKTELQIEKLREIDALAKRIAEVEEHISKLLQEKDHAAYWFACKTVELCDEEIEKCKEDLKLLKENLDKLKQQEKELNEEKTKLNVAIDKDEVGSRIKNLEKEINQLESSKTSRLNKSNEYNAIVRVVGLTESTDEETFNSNRTTAKTEKDRLQQVIEKELAEEKRRTKNKEEEIDTDIKDKLATITYLREHKNNISGREAEIRDDILEYTGATAEEIPFIGELIKVKDDERDWEHAIERILHNFALRLIVPEKYYIQVNEYVNSHNLKGRIVYQRYQGFASLKSMQAWRLSDDCLLGKIEFKPKSQYVEWIEDVIYNEYNYACVDSLEEFNNRQEKAVTKPGLIKSVKGKHEKDDRAHVFKRENYVLGWNNKEKLIALKNEVIKLQEQQKAVAAKIREIDGEIKEKTSLRDRFSELFSSYKRFEEIDWWSYAKLIQDKADAKRLLEATNNRVKALQEQLRNVETKLEAIDRQKEDIIGKRTKANGRIESLNKTRNDNAQLIALGGIVDTTEFEEHHPEIVSISFSEIESTRIGFLHKNSNETQEQERLKSKYSIDVKLLIDRFKNPSEEITTRFRDWRSDVNSLPTPEHLELISEYQTLYKRLQEEDLVSFKEQFERYLRETITNNVNSFRIYFSNWEDAIKKTIDQLNESLREIDFNTHPAKTYIQLGCSHKFDVEANEFREMLKMAVPNLREVESTIDGRKNHFENHIAPFIKKLSDEQWRSRVMNVRTWFTYKAEEFYKESDQKYKTYESMGQLSGGEKAQLTYTILGSAIAYQFGLTKTGLESSFRFIAIDEAFKAQDEDKARYLLSLCKQLHLQLLVVTPSDNIHIVENDISVVHYVERKDDGRSMLIDMPITQFKEEREKFAQQ